MTFDDNELQASIRLTLRGGIRSPGNLTLDAWSSGPGAPPRNGTAGGCEAPERRHMRGRAPAFVSFQSSLSHFFFFFVFLSFRAAPTAYGGSQARGPFRAVAAGLHHSHSHVGSWPHLQLHHSSPQRQILNPLSEAGVQTHILMDTSQVCYLLSHDGNSPLPILNKSNFPLGTCVCIWRHIYTPKAGSGQCCLCAD